MDATTVEWTIPSNI